MDGQYGAMQFDPVKTSGLYKGRRMNAISILMCLFIPWLLFCAVFSVRTFSIRESNAGLATGVVLCAALLILVVAMLAYQSLQKKWHGDPRYEPMWYIFLFLTMLLAFILALLGGEWIWQNTFAAHYGMEHLNEYSYIDPSRMRGQQIMDAGIIHFVPGAALDTRLSLGFRNNDVYCVSPISVGAAPLASYDFWAVGLNCCSGSPGDFKCGDYQSTSNVGGMRLMNDGQRAYYRLAVQQAEAMFNIRADHPLFFHYVADPQSESDSVYAEGWKYYTIGMVAHFCLQLFLVVIATILFGKIGAY